MPMSTQTLHEAAALLTSVLVDMVQIMDVGEPVTVGTKVTRSLTPVGLPVPGLVQTTTLANAVESQTTNTFSIKVAAGTTLKAGQAIKVLHCRMEPDLSLRVLLVDKMSENGMALIRKGVATTATVVNQQGKESLVA